jgi:antitoxin PrlF
MIGVKLRSKGLITIPIEIRERLGIQPGDAVDFEESEGAILMKKVVAESPFDKWEGSLKHLKGRRSDDVAKEMRGNR